MKKRKMIGSKAYFNGKKVFGFFETEKSEVNSAQSNYINYIIDKNELSKNDVLLFLKVNDTLIFPGDLTSLNKKYITNIYFNVLYDKSFTIKTTVNYTNYEGNKHIFYNELPERYNEFSENEIKEMLLKILVDEAND